MNRKVFFGAGAVSLASTTLGVLLLALLLPPARTEAAEVAGDLSVERGRYVVRTSGCNDCHTAGYLENSGKVPESEWLKGQSTGYRGPWGTTYPANLRLTVRNLTEDQWVTFARAERLPPMPWFNVVVMSESDLRAMYRYIRWLGAAGERAPAPLPPGKEGTLPFISFMPQTPPLARQR